MDTHARFLRAAEAFDTWRVVPRIILLGYCAWCARVTDVLVHWYMTMPAAERTGQVTAFATIVLPGVFGLAVWVFKVYSANGRNWSDAPAPEDPKP